MPSLTGRSLRNLRKNAVSSSSFRSNRRHYRGHRRHNYADPLQRYSWKEWMHDEHFLERCGNPHLSPSEPPFRARNV